MPALPSALARWGALEWVLAALAAIMVLVAAGALITVIVRQWILPLLRTRGR
jgi:hypothetical protein